MKVLPAPAICVVLVELQAVRVSRAVVAARTAFVLNVKIEISSGMLVEHSAFTDVSDAVPLHEAKPNHFASSRALAHYREINAVSFVTLATAWASSESYLAEVEHEQRTQGTKNSDPGNRWIRAGRANRS
jgi:hypothetical protein